MYGFIHNYLIVDSEMGTLLGLTVSDKAMNTYRKLYNSKKPEALDRTMCEAAKYLAEMVAMSLGKVVEQLTVVLFDFHQQKYRTRKPKVRMKAIEEKNKLREGNEEM